MTIPKLKHLRSVGELYHDFKITKITEIPELQCILRELIHLPTGAQVMHIANDDPENLFCLSFKTIPQSSNGVAHILEHTVLCGSEKYPVKDPFFGMTRRSLNTFMNALTGADFTCYPAASQVPKDLYNLLEVYLDAVFHPNLNELSFLQEGHRLEFSVTDDPNSPLEHKGIVFNEMKGALNSPSARLAEAMNHALYPQLTYGYNSGGDPKEIPHLSYLDLCAFHQTHYHPSRCLFFFYGDLPLEGHLDFIAKHALEGVKKVDPLPPLPIQPRFLTPKTVELEFPISPEEELSDKAMISFGWLTCHILKQQEVLALSILEIVLMDTDASPLKLALLRSGLCKQVSAMMDIDVSEVPIMLTLRGCKAEDVDQIKELLQKTLHDIIEEGIPLYQIENAMHQLEFHRSEITGNHSPFGLSLFMRSALLKQHGGNPEDGLMIHTLFENTRRLHLENPHYFTDLIKKYLLENPHFVTIIMKPNPELMTKELEEEKIGLEKIREKLTPGQIKHILERSKTLIEFQKRQEDEEDVDILPKLSLSDVSPASRYYTLSQETCGPLQVFHHDCFTNDIVYADLFYDLSKIAEEELPLVRLLTTLIAQMGSGGKRYTETLEAIQANTGGIGSYLTSNIQAQDPNLFFPAIAIRGKALCHKVGKLFPLICSMVESIDLSDHDRLKEVLLKQYTSLHGSLAQSALRYAINLSASSLDVSSQISNKWYGIDYYQTIRSIVENLDQEIEPLSKKLHQLHGRLFGLKNPHLVLSCDKKTYEELKQHQFYGLFDLPTKPFTPWSDDYPLQQVKSQGRLIPSPVAFTSHVFKTIPYVHPDSPALSVAAALFDNLVLHAKIREQGGAYGGGAINNTLSGSFYFYAYRDPNISATLAAFEEAIKTIVDGQFEASDIEEATLEIVQGLDAPVSPGSRADLAYGWMREGKPPEVRQAYRNQLLALTKQDIIDAVKRHIVPRNEEGTTVVFAGKELLEKENALLVAQHKQPLIVKPI